MKKLTVLIAFAAIATAGNIAAAQNQPSNDKQVDRNVRDANEAHERDRQQQERDKAQQNDRDGRSGVTVDKNGVRR